MSNPKSPRSLRQVVGAAGVAVGLAAGGFTIASAASDSNTSQATVRRAATPADATTGTAALADHRGGWRESVGDTSVAAKAIGISEAALSTALAGGKTMAQVATAHGVAPARVIEALVVDARSELAAEVKSGELTQARADQEQTEATQRATDQVNGQFRSDDEHSAKQGETDGGWAHGAG